MPATRSTRRVLFTLKLVMAPPMTEAFGTITFLLSGVSSVVVKIPISLTPPVIPAASTTSPSPNGLKIMMSTNIKPISEFIELHIGAGPGDAYPQGALDHLAENKTVTLEIGLGHAHLNSASERPIVLMAGGTGFSYVKSIADYLAETKPFHTVLLYWGAKNEESLYASEYLAEWANKFPHFQYIPVVEEAEDNWSGKVGYVHQAVMEDIVSLEPYDIYLAGPFKMAGIAREDFINHKGAIKEHMFADAFAFI